MSCPLSHDGSIKEAGRWIRPWCRQNINLWKLIMEKLPSHVTHCNVNLIFCVKSYFRLPIIINWCVIAESPCKSGWGTNYPSSCASKQVNQIPPFIHEPWWGNDRLIYLPSTSFLDSQAGFFYFVGKASERCRNSYTLQAHLRHRSDVFATSRKIQPL